MLVTLLMCLLIDSSRSKMTPRLDDVISYVQGQVDAVHLFQVGFGAEPDYFGFRGIKLNTSG